MKKPIYKIGSYRPLNNLCTIQKIIEEYFITHLEPFLTKNKIIHENHHGGRRHHSTVTAKTVLDKEINKLRDKKKSIAITTTDLTAAFDTCDTILLTTMMEHIGIREIELEILTTYLTNQRAYVELQGFFATLRIMPNCSVIQGSKMSSTLYTIYTLDSTKTNEIMEDPVKFKEIVKRDLVETNEPDHTSVGYIDDVTHVTGLDNKDELEVYINELYALLKSMYTNKKLQINGSKTKILTIINNRETDKQHSYIIIDNTPSTSRDSQIVTNIFTKAHKIPFLSDLIKNQSLEFSMEVTSDNLQWIPGGHDYQDPPQIIGSTEATKCKSFLPVWILDSYEVMERKMKGATSLQELPDKYQLKGVFKAAANSRIKYLSVYDKNGMPSWPTIVSNHLHEDEDLF